MSLLANLPSLWDWLIFTILLSALCVVFYKNSKWYDDIYVNTQFFFSLYFIFCINLLLITLFCLITLLVYYMIYGLLVSFSENTSLTVLLCKHFSSEIGLHTYLSTLFDKGLFLHYCGHGRFNIAYLLHKRSKFLTWQVFHLCLACLPCYLISTCLWRVFYFHIHVNLLYCI